jgi:heme oxygenase
VDGIAGLDTYLPDYAHRRKSTLLLNDISKLKGNHTLDICSNIPAITNVCQAIGALYVLEGSTLGGRFIYRNIESALDLQVNSGASFFYGYFL